jgi:hypothetical protein
MKNYSELMEKVDKFLSEISPQDLAIKLASYGMEFETFECQECGLDTPKYMRYADSDICQGCGNCA